jgi:hypothetical protein
LLKSYAYQVTDIGGHHPLRNGNLKLLGRLFTCSLGISDTGYETRRVDFGGGTGGGLRPIQFCLLAQKGGEVAQGCTVHGPKEGNGAESNLQNRREQRRMSGEQKA